MNFNDALTRKKIFKITCIIAFCLLNLCLELNYCFFLCATFLPSQFLISFNFTGSFYCWNCCCCCYSGKHYDYVVVALLSGEVKIQQIYSDDTECCICFCNTYTYVFK